MPSRKWGFSNIKPTGSKGNSTEHTYQHWIQLGEDTIPLLPSSSTSSSDGSMHSADGFQASSHQGFSSSTSSTSSSDGSMHLGDEYQASSHQGFSSSTDDDSQFAHIRGGSGGGPGPGDVTPSDREKEEEKERIKRLRAKPLRFFANSFLRYHLAQKNYDKLKRDKKEKVKARK